MGSVASIFILFAIFLIYLNLGTLNLALISQNIGSIDSKILFFITLMLFIGFGIKTEIFPRKLLGA